MTGEPRTASVFAVSDVECYRVDKDAFQDILRGRPELARDISHVLARRRIELDAVYQQLTEEAKRHHMQTAQRDILNRIVGFFRLNAPDGE
jgi:CRP-like cAMP-binding protein